MRRSWSIFGHTNLSTLDADTDINMRNTAGAGTEQHVSETDLW